MNPKLLLFFIKFVVCFGLFKTDFRLRIKEDKTMQKIELFIFIKKDNLHFFENQHLFLWKKPRFKVFGYGIWTDEQVTST